MTITDAIMAARFTTATLCRAVVVAAMVARVLATPSGDPEPDATFIFDIGAGRQRLPVAMTAANVRHLPTDTMFGKLGHHFDPNWMSVRQPTTSRTVSGRNRSRDDPEVVRDLRRLRFTYRDESGSERRLSAAVVMELERWLLEQSRCEVMFTWEDMGELFWPRWVRHGRCDSLAVCSWPPGMYCAPAPSDTLRLLHWQCRRRPTVADRGRVTRNNEGSPLVPQRAGSRPERRRSRMRSGRHPLCRWKKVPYPVTAECFCSC